jgi:hypothetical protein
MVKRTQYRFHNGHFGCGQVNVLMAFNDIGPGDGATMVIPGSHKANFRHPDAGKAAIVDGQSNSVDEVEGAVEVHLNAGDAVMFVDSDHARLSPARERGPATHRRLSIRPVVGHVPPPVSAITGIA